MPRTVKFLRDSTDPAGAHHTGDLVVVGAGSTVVTDNATADQLVAAGIVADVPARTIRFLRNIAGPAGSHVVGDLVVVGGGSPIVPDDAAADALVSAGVVADVPVPPGHYTILPTGERVFIQDKRV